MVHKVSRPVWYAFRKVRKVATSAEESCRVLLSALTWSNNVGEELDEETWALEKEGGAGVWGAKRSNYWGNPTHCPAGWSYYIGLLWSRDRKFPPPCATKRWKEFFVLFYNKDRGKDKNGWCNVCKGRVCVLSTGWSPRFPKGQFCLLAFLFLDRSFVSSMSPLLPTFSTQNFANFIVRLLNSALIVIIQSLSTPDHQIFYLSHSDQSIWIQIYISMRGCQMLGKVESDLPAKIWRLVGCTEMISWKAKW